MLQDMTLRLGAGHHLSPEEAELSLELMLSEETPDAVIASFLTAMAIKGETADEIQGFARGMRRHVVAIRTDHPKLVDTAGTGGGLDTFNVSTTAAFVIAGAGLPVAKHGNRAVTSRCGSADLLTALGVDVQSPPEVAEECLNTIGVAFLFAPVFHPAMKRVASIRRQLGHRTIFNLLGPLTNPAAATHQIVGVFSPGLTEKMAQALKGLGCRRAWVVHSLDGLDELSTGAPARVSEVADDAVRSFEFQPVGAYDMDALRGGTPEQNAQITRGILEGRTLGPARDIVVLNAAAALYLAEEDVFSEALRRAEGSIDGGAAAEKLRQLIDASSHRPLYL